MKCRNIYALALASIVLFASYQSYGQKLTIDSAAFKDWPTLQFPFLSPDGKYFTYSVNNSPVGFNTAIVKSTTGPWQKEFSMKAPSFLNCAMSNRHSVFIKGEDTLCIVKLGQSVEYYHGYNSFELCPNDKLNAIIATGGDSAVLLKNDTKSFFRGVISCHFVMGGTKILIHQQVKDAKDGTSPGQRLILVDINSSNERVVWQGGGLESLILNKQADHLAFLYTDSSSQRLEKRVIYVDLDRMSKIEVRNSQYPSLSIAELICFTNEYEKLILRLKDTSKIVLQPNPQKLTLWSYTDVLLQDEQASRFNERSYLASISLENQSLTKLEEPNEEWNLANSPKNWKKQWLVKQTVGDCAGREQFWNPSCEQRFFLVDVSTAERFRLPALEGRNRFNQYQLSPNGKFVVFYDYDSTSYYVYAVESGVLKELSAGSAKKAFDNSFKDYIPMPQRGIAAWGKDGHDVFVYDEYDIWHFDLSNSSLVQNITNGYGRKHNVSFSFLNTSPFDGVSGNNGIILRALNLGNKDNGFYSITQKFSEKDPVLLSMGGYIYYMPTGQIVEHEGMEPLKARDKNIFVVKRESSHEFPNFFLTEDFKSFKQQSFLSPEAKYHWVQTRLITWTLPDGKESKGVIYLPENFDITRKYPVVFNIYDKYSNSLNAYIPPDALCNGCAVNPALLVSSGYLVFKPDIHYKLNKTGQSAQIALESAIEVLGRYQWIDTSKIGLQGCSFGAFQANYLVTHSNRFRAVCSASGVTDILSFGSTFYSSVYSSFAWGQLRLTRQPWEDSEVYVDNSAIFHAGAVQAPLLLFRTSEDNAVPSVQGLELFLMLRKLGKPAWLLEYGDADHGVFDPLQASDFSKRMLQFFDVYLRDQPAPVWMRKGIKAGDPDISKSLGY